MKCYTLLAITILFTFSISGMELDRESYKREMETWDKFNAEIRKNSAPQVAKMLQNTHFQPCQLSFALECAIAYRSMDSLAVLLRYGCPVNLRVRDIFRQEDNPAMGNTPLYRAVLEGNPTAVRWLIIYGADPLIESGYRPMFESPLELAKSTTDLPNRAEMLAILENPGAFAFDHAIFEKHL